MTKNPHVAAENPLFASRGSLTHPPLFKKKAKAFLFDQLAHFFAGCEFYGFSRGDHNGNRCLFGISSDLLLSLYDFKYAKIAKLQTISFRQAVGHLVEKSLDDASNVIRMQSFRHGNLLDEFLFRNSRHSSAPILALDI